jgi:P27 family predicted phage terminase small subunit
MRRRTESEHRLRGNPGHRPVRKSLKAVPLTRLPAPPACLNETARAIWYEVGRQLVGEDRLARTDLPTLENYARYQALIRDNEAAMAGQLTVRSKRSAPRPHPGIRVMLQAGVIAARLAAELGLSPKSRAGIPASEQKEKADPLEEFLRTGKAATNDDAPEVFQ